VQVVDVGPVPQVQAAVAGVGAAGQTAGGVPAVHTPVAALQVSPLLHVLAIGPLPQVQSAVTGVGGTGHTAGGDGGPPPP
jgi:hypothetical protein